ncbi:ABC transporter, permease protein [Aeropyrum pernix]|uniref:ABC transporter, permease protein n=1 Tax=Aeropyrum pernix TaxID=56636 RepID=A0A401H7U9_AERPX|nr:carbohydrate ABC transporter permease [Aeropyrum pernix]GBF08536.1 ABC transporter, permease protein [Aeropyrum pernix]
MVSAPAWIGELARYAFLAVLVSWIIVPLAISIVYAFTPLDVYYSDAILTTSFTLDHVKTLWVLGAGEAFLRSVAVGAMTVGISFLLGLPGGYALARYVFPGRDAVKLAIIATRMFPIIVISVSLLKTFFNLGLNDTLIGLALAHTAMALPFVVIITGSIFGGIPRDLEEAGMIFGLSSIMVFLRITLPLAAPGLTAAGMFTFLLSWNEVFMASVLTLVNRTLPAFILNSAFATPIEPIRFAAAFMLILPALVFMFLARRYLVTMWAMAAR